MERDSSHEPSSILPAIQREIQEGCTEISPQYGMGMSSVGEFVYFMGFLEGKHADRRVVIQSKTR